MKVRGYIIHLARATARKPAVEAMCAAAPCEMEVFDAIDGSALSPGELYADVAAQTHIRPHYPFELSKGEVACFLSHRTLWQRMQEDDADAALILEDDAVLDPETFAKAFELAKAHISEQGVIQFQTRAAPKDAEVLDDVEGVRLLRPKVPMLRTTAALISKDAAARLLAGAQTLDRPVDAFLQLTYATGQVIAVVAPSGVSEMSAELGGTTIQARKKSAAETLQREVKRAFYRLRVRINLGTGPQIPGLKALSYGVQAVFLGSLRGLARLLPLHMRSALGGHAIHGAVRLVPKMRNRIEDNLRRIYPDMSPVTRSRLIGAIARNTGRTATEIIFNQDFAKSAGKIPISGPGLAALEQAKAEGKGAIIVSGHFGQWEAIRHALKARGLETGAIYRKNNTPYFETLWRNGIEAGGKPIIARSAAGSRNMLKHIRSGGFIALLMDQYTQEGTTLRFMGHPAVTAISAAQLALRYDLPLVPIFSVRTRDGFEITAQDPIPHTHAVKMMQDFNDRLGAQVDAHPSQWLWLHNRWKLAPWNDPVPSHED